MNKIYRRDTRHVSVEEAKRLIREARQWGDPGDLVAGVYVAEDGLLDMGDLEDLHGLYVGDDFQLDCQRLDILPFDKYRPSLEVTYPGGTSADSSFAIKYVDLIRLADLYGLEVVIGQPSPASPAPQAQEPSEPAPVQAAAVPLWGLKSRDQMQRSDYLRDALYAFLSRADKTQPLPTPGQVMEAWRVRLPVGVSRVNSASVDFETKNADGEKQCDLAALKERIKNMTTVSE